MDETMYFVFLDIFVIYKSGKKQDWESDFTERPEFEVSARRGNYLPHFGLCSALNFPLNHRAFRS